MADKNIEIGIKATADTAEVEELSSVVKSLQTDANSAGEALQQAFQQATSEVDALTSELAAIEMGDSAADFEEVSQALSEAEAEAEMLSQALDAVNGGNASGVATEFDELGNSADKADTEVQELQGSMDLLNAQALMGIATELSSLGGQAEGMAQEMNTAAISVGQLATQTGIAEPQMVSLINNISNATFPNDEAMMYVKSLDQIGVASGNLGQSATDLDKINDAFGLGASTVNSLGQELSVLGVDMNNVSSSFNALAYANANTVGGMENYYSFLKRYDAQFAEMGFNVDQASIIIAGATQKFGGGRAALSGLSTALKECNGDTRALEQALGLEAGSLDHASEITGQYEGQLQQLANEEAEHKSILDQLNAAWEDMSLALSPVLSPLMSFMGLIGQAGSWAVGVNGLITLGQYFREMSAVQTALGYLGGLKSAIGGIGGAFSSLWGVLIANPIILVVIAIVALIAAFIWAYNNVDWFREMVDNAWASIQGFAGWISGAFMDAINGIGEAFTNAGQTLQDAFTGAVQFVQDTLQGLYDYIMTLGGLLPQGVNITGNQIVDSILAVMLFIATLPMQIGMYFMNIIAQTLGFGNNFVQTMFNSAMNAVMGFIQWVSQIPSRLGSFLSNTISSAVSFASNFISTITNAASNAVSNFVSWISQLPQKLGEELNKMIQQALDFAARLPQIIGEAAANMVGSWVGNSGEQSPGFMYDAFEGEIKEMDKIGADFSKTFPSHLGSAADDMVNNFNPNLNSGVPSVSNTGDAGSGFRDLIINIDNVDNEDRINQIVEAIRKELNWNNVTAGRTV